MINTSIKRVKYFYQEGTNQQFEMLWAVTSKQVYYLSCNVWLFSALTYVDALRWFNEQPDIHPVSLYQVQHMGKIKTPKNL